MVDKKEKERMRKGLCEIGTIDDIDRAITSIAWSFRAVTAPKWVNR